MSNKTLRIKKICIGNELPAVLIAGPCQIENLDHSRKIADALSNLSRKLNFDFIFKGSFDKANRTSINSKRGVGIEEGLAILSKIKSEFDLSIGFC